MISADDFVLQLVQDRGLVAPEMARLALEQLKAEDVVENLESRALDLLVENGYFTWEDATAALAAEFDMELAELKVARPTEEALRKIGRDLCTKHTVFPLDYDSHRDSCLTLAIADPLDTDAVDGLSRLLKVDIKTLLATPAAIREAIEIHYAPMQGEGDENSARWDVAADPNGVQLSIPTGNEAGTKEEDAPIIRYVNMVVTEAIKRRASDIHMEPLEKRFRVRYRIDGVLQEVENPPKRLQASIISRLKLMAEVSLAEKRVPQDGRIQVKANGKDIDLRVSVLPTVYGESIVMRILDKEGLRLGLPELGFFADDQSTFLSLITGADGIFLVTGPTGSGKSTTLYGALNHINQPDRKIITVEDPVEYQMFGINQVQVRREIGMTFAAALRAMLRQAPNIIMIGEIRDLETAEIAINASLTGHMVFSTLHTNDAPGAVTRLIDIGVKPFLVSASLRGVLAQRLVRRICANCAEPYTPSIKELASIGMAERDLPGTQFKKGAGCVKCGGAGYKGRRGIFEIFVMNEEMQELVYRGASLVEIRHKAREIGMRTMREDGIRKAAAGMTSIEEVLSATVSVD